MANRLANDFPNDYKGISTQAIFLNSRVENLLASSDTSQDIEFENKQNELTSCRTKLSSLNAVLTGADFKLPQVMLKEISSLEVRIEKLKIELELLATSVEVESLEIENSQSIIDLFMTDEGRAKLNMFFKHHDISFFVSHDKSTKQTNFEMRNSKGERVARSIKTYPLKNILGKFGIGDLQTMFGLTVN